MSKIRKKDLVFIVTQMVVAIEACGKPADSMARESSLHQMVRKRGASGRMESVSTGSMTDKIQSSITHKICLNKLSKLSKYCVFPSMKAFENYR